MDANRVVKKAKGFIALTSVLAVSACGAAGEGLGDSAEDSRPASTTRGADLPGGEASDEETMAIGEGIGRDAPDAPPAPGAPKPRAPAPGEPAPAAPQHQIPSGPMPYRGINLAGAEFGAAIPGRDGVDYTFPTPAEVDYYLAKGMNTFRIGFKWERLQRSAYGELDAAYFARLDSIVRYAASRGAQVILNPHNFARYYGSTVGSARVPSAVFADLWRRLARAYVDTPSVLFNLVNEPHSMPTEQWVRAANAAIAAIRGAGAKQLVLVPGNSWTGAHSWSSGSYGTPNAVAMLDVVDPADNMVFEVHQYLDADSSGGGSTCVGPKIGRQRLANFVTWLRDHGKKGFVGEFAGVNDPTCRAAVTDMLRYMMESSDVLVGWLWWAGGPWWGEYKFTLEPRNGRDRPQMALLAPFLD